VVLGLALAAAALAGAMWWWQAARRAPRRPNLLLVTIDTLRADRLGAYGYAGAVTPALDGLAARGVRFAAAQASSPLTGPSHATILTGRYPPVTGMRENVNFILDERRETLAQRLKAAGYATAGFVGAYPVAATFGFGRGFDVFDEGLHANPGIGQGAERPGNEVADAAAAWLQRAPNDAPFFAWVHFYDPHLPYAAPAPLGEQFRERPYDGEIAFTDTQVARLLAAVRAGGHEPDTVVVVTSDHGEGLGEHGEATHGLLLYETTLSVPLILAGPGVPAGRVPKARAGSADIVPTVLDLLGLPVPEGLPGRRLKPSFEGGKLPSEPLYSEALFGRLNCRWAALRGWTQGDWKLVDGGETELFDLASDPHETRNRAAAEPTRVAEMRTGLRRAVEAMAPGGDRPQSFTVSPEQAEALQSLGYTAGGGGAGPIDDPTLPDPRPRVGALERLQTLQGAVGPGLEPAVVEVGSIVQADPGNPFGFFVLGSLAYRAGHLGLAEKSFARTLELDPKRPIIRQYYGALLRDLGKLEESERELRLAVKEAAADDHITRVSLADTLIAAGKRDEASALLQDILQREPRHSKAHASLGRLLVTMGRPADALPHLEKAAASGDVEGLLQLASVHLALGQAGDARVAAERVFQKEPAHPWALAMAAHAAILEGQRDAGLAMLRRAVAVGPRRAAVWDALGAAFEAAGEKGEAERCRRSARSTAAARVKGA
jgi:arylsulfatase A-like enzyme/Tfp pilus assembly protein PilF